MLGCIGRGRGEQLIVPASEYDTPARRTDISFLHVCVGAHHQMSTHSGLTTEVAKAIPKTRHAVQRADTFIEKLGIAAAEKPSIWPEV